MTDRELEALEETLREMTKDIAQGHPATSVYYRLMSLRTEEYERRAL